jgi:hypothetical protein
MKINNFNQLIAYFNQPEIEFKHIQQICNEGLGVIFINDYSKRDAINLLIDYWQTWGDKVERPIFIGLDIGVE